MSSHVNEWRETISRGAVIALMNNFRSVAEALRELVDNAIDYRWGQSLVIDITEDKKHDRIVIECDGGRGMGAEEIQFWLSWGEGEKHDPLQFGMWYIGGKAACGYLARHVRLWAKRQGSDDIWFLEDEDWATRLREKNFGIPKPLPNERYPQTMQNLPADRGHVRIELTKLSKEKRWNLEVLKRDLSNTYSNLLQPEEIEIKINGGKVSPLKIPLSTAVEKIKLDVSLADGRSASGWAGRMMRGQETAPLKAGLRLVHNGRLIKEGEWFGYNYAGKGAFNSLVGELHLKGFKPTPNKTDFVDRGDEIWEQLGDKALEQLKPLIATLRESSEEARVTRSERKRVQKVADDLERVFASLTEKPEIEKQGDNDGKGMKSGPAGRERPKPRPPRQPVQNPRGPNQNPRQPRTPPPDDPVGSLARLLQKVTGGKTRPPLRIQSWDPSERSAWTPDAGKVWLDINKSYHLYKHLGGAEAYIAETAILELCAPRDSDNISATAFLGKVNLMLLKWSEVATQEDTG